LYNKTEGTTINVRADEPRSSLSNQRDEDKTDLIGPNVEHLELTSWAASRRQHVVM